MTFGFSFAVVSTLAVLAACGTVHESVIVVEELRETTEAPQGHTHQILVMQTTQPNRLPAVSQTAQWAAARECGFLAEDTNEQVTLGESAILLGTMPNGGMTTEIYTFRCPELGKDA